MKSERRPCPTCGIVGPHGCLGRRIPPFIRDFTPPLRAPKIYDRRILPSKLEPTFKEWSPVHVPIDLDRMRSSIEASSPIDHPETEATLP